MNDPGTPPDVWHLLFEQLPTALRWLLGILTLGGFSLASWIWHRQERNIDRVEVQIHRRMDREMNALNERLDNIDRSLIQIAQNTRGGRND